MKLRSAFLLLACYTVCFASPGMVQEETPVSVEAYLRESAVPKSVIDTFLDPDALSWAQFDPELGYILGNYLPHDGMNGSPTLSTVQKNGARTAHLYIDRNCRINTYGDSFTQCHQVSDGETGQEYLAAHLGEPIRNFGMGGYGVYQAYRRMLSEEKTKNGAEYVILYIWGDDHLRSLLRCRHALICSWWDPAGGRLFHNNFWANVEMDLEAGKIVECENRLPTPESLYRMADPDCMVENLEDALVLQMYLFVRGYINDADWIKVIRLSEILGLEAPDRSTPEAEKKSVRRVLDKFGFAATKFILRKARDFTGYSGKKLLVVLNDPR